MLKSTLFILCFLNLIFFAKPDLYTDDVNSLIVSNEEIRVSDPIIRYGGKHAFLTLSKISSQTFEIVLSPLESIHSSEPEMPGSDLISEYKSDQIWKSRTVMDPVRGGIGDYILEVLRSPLRLVFRREDNTIIQEFRWPDGEEGELQVRAESPLYRLESTGNNSEYRGKWIRMKEQSTNYPTEADETKDDPPFVLSGTDGWTVFIHKPAGNDNSFKLEDGRGTFIPDPEMLDSPVHIFLILWDHPNQLKTEFERFAGENLAEAVRSSDLTMLKE